MFQFEFMHIETDHYPELMCKVRGALLTQCWGSEAGK